MSEKVAASKTHFFATNAPSNGGQLAPYHQTICAVKSHLARLQHSRSLEKYENKKVFELNV